MSITADIGIIGGRSFVGCILLKKLISSGFSCWGFTRSSQGLTDMEMVKSHLKLYSDLKNLSDQSLFKTWFCLAPIWVLPDYFSLLEAHGVQKVIAVSSTSRISKLDSLDPKEQVIAEKLMEGEEALKSWCTEKGIDWVIIRPTLIYGLGRDKNITAISAFIRRFGFFPILGDADGLRQPIHAEDMADVCIAAMMEPKSSQQIYHVSGGETITYREMVIRVFKTLGKPVKILKTPFWIFRVVVLVLGRLPRYQFLSIGMVERMNEDLIFQNDKAMNELNFRSRPFILTEKDI
ncbi:MAG: epimerase [Legionella sp.]|nr:MAG: epimerase [Legionella sp.]